MKKLLLAAALATVSLSAAADTYVLGDASFTRPTTAFETTAGTGVNTLNLSTLTNDAETVNTLLTNNAQALTTLPVGSTVIISVGTNDFTSGVSRSTTRSAIASAVFLLASTNRDFNIIVLDAPNIASAAEIGGAKPLQADVLFTDPSTVFWVNGVFKVRAFTSPIYVELLNVPQLVDATKGALNEQGNRLLDLWLRNSVNELGGKTSAALTTDAIASLVTGLKLDLAGATHIAKVFNIPVTSLPVNLK
jgi:hypothetical protein